MYPPVIDVLDPLVLFWVVLGVLGALPFLLSESRNISVTDAIFESISGLTTTGASVFVNLESLPKSILFYRQFLQWLGGLGIIVLAVAILPILGIGGMQLYRAESLTTIKEKVYALICFLFYCCGVGYLFLIM